MVIKLNKIGLMLFFLGFIVFIVLIVNSSNVSASVCKNYERAVRWGHVRNKTGEQRWIGIDRNI